MLSWGACRRLPASGRRQTCSHPARPWGAAGTEEAVQLWWIWRWRSAPAARAGARRRFRHSRLGGFPWNLFRKARAKRGDVRAAILSLLAEKPLNGYQIMQELEQRSRGSWRPSPGAVYPALRQLEDEGLVCAESAYGGRTFSLTEKGRTYVHAHPDEFAAPWEAANQPAGDDPMLGLFAELKHIAAATIQVVHTGSSIQVREAQKILNQARKALYRLLADDVAEEGDE